MKPGNQTTRLIRPNFKSTKGGLNRGVLLCMQFLSCNSYGPNKNLSLAPIVCRFCLCAFNDTVQNCNLLSSTVEASWEQSSMCADRTKFKHSVVEASKGANSVALRRSLVTGMLKQATSLNLKKQDVFVKHHAPAKRLFLRKPDSFGY